MEKFYLVSLKRTHPKDVLITFWRSNSRGYCLFKQELGTYTEDQIKNSNGYYDSETTKPVKQSIVDPLFEEVRQEGRSLMVIKNTPENRRALGIKEK